MKQQQSSWAVLFAIIVIMIFGMALWALSFPDRFVAIWESITR